MSDERPEARDPQRERADALIGDPATRDVVGNVVGYLSRRTPQLADEFESHAWLAAWRAALDHREDSGVAWPAFLWYRVRNDLITFRRGWMHDGGRTRTRPAMLSIHSLDESVDAIPSDDMPVGWEMESEDAVNGLLGLAPSGYRSTLRAMFLECSEDRRQMADRLGVAPSMLTYNRDRGIGMIRGAMGVEDGRAAG